MPKKPKAPAKKNKQPKKTSEAPVSRAKRIRSFRLRKRADRPKPPKPARKLTGSFRLFTDSTSLLRQHWKLFGGITVVYLLLSIFLVGGLGGGYNVSELKSTFTEELGQLSASVALFGLLIGSTGSAGSEGGAAYQTIVILLVSLATIWSLRQILAGERVTIRDAFYKGMYPLIPFILVLLFLCVQLVPALIGSFIYNSVFGGGLAATAPEQALWVVLVFLLMVWSLYLLSSRIFALYIVTLPDVRPMVAIKAARKLVLYRRWQIIRKLLFLPFVLIVIGGAIILPLIMILPVVVLPVFVLLSLLALIFAHTYTYNLYKELL